MYIMRETSPTITVMRLTSDNSWRFIWSHSVYRWEISTKHKRPMNIGNSKVNGNGASFRSWRIRCVQLNVSTIEAEEDAND